MRLITSFFALLLSLLICSTNAHAQLADKVVAIVGKGRIILHSDLELQVEQMRKQLPHFDDSMKCLLLQQMIVEKLLVEQADRDSLIATDEEIEARLDNRIRYFLQAYGSREQLEASAGKTIYQLKDDYRDFTKDQILSERMRADILSNVRVTPVEVTAFFEEAARDTLPFFPGTVEVGQIVVLPPVNPVLDKYAADKLADIRNDIVNNGSSFEALAGLYSEDPGSRDNGGDLGVVRRTEVVPEFAAAGFKLKDGEISPVIKSKFGYHIIKMIGREGEGAHLKHILIKPQYSSNDFATAIVGLDTIKQLLTTKKLSFEEAVGKYSTDDQTKMSGGLLTNLETGSTQLLIDELDPIAALMIDSLQVGGYSDPHLYVNRQTGEKSARLIYLRSRTEPHQANLKDDYNQIMQLALERKKAKKLEDWIYDKLPDFYIRIAPEYATCPPLKRWNTASR